MKIPHVGTLLNSSVCLTFLLCPFFHYSPTELWSSMSCTSPTAYGHLLMLEKNVIVSFYAFGKFFLKHIFGPC